jgi:hypothetical protein
MNYLAKSITLPSGPINEFSVYPEHVLFSLFLSPILFFLLIVWTVYSFFIKNKLEKKWFKAKNYGYGWYPSSFKGWLVIIVYLLYIATSFTVIDSNSQTTSDTLINFIPWTLFATVMLIVIAYNTGEKARWRWGK